MRQVLAVIFLLVIVAIGFSAYYEAPPEPVIAVAEPLTIDGLLKSFDQLMVAARPMHNRMTTHLVLNDPEARSLLAVHPFFSKHEFDYGPLQPLVQSWMNAHCGVLLKNDIRYIALGNDSGEIVARLRVECRSMER